MNCNWSEDSRTRKNEIRTRKNEIRRCRGEKKKSEGAGKKSNILAYVQYCSSLTRFLWRRRRVRDRSWDWDGARWRADGDGEGRSWREGMSATERRRSWDREGMDALWVWEGMREFCWVLLRVAKENKTKSRTWFLCRKTESIRLGFLHINRV